MDIRFHVARDGTHARITFDHAPSRNSLDRATRAELIDALDRLDADDSVRVISVTGTDPAFTSGVDAKQLLDDANYQPLPVNPAERIRSLTTPTIAEVNGACVSGGLEIMLSCSFAIASERAIFADTHAKLGILPGWGLSYALPDAVGVARAAQMSFTGQPIDARTAVQWGLVNEVHEHVQLRGRVDELAAAIGALPVESVRDHLALYRSGWDDATAQDQAREASALESFRASRRRQRTQPDP